MKETLRASLPWSPLSDAFEDRKMRTSEHANLIILTAQTIPRASVRFVPHRCPPHADKDTRGERTA